VHCRATLPGAQDFVNCFNNSIEKRKVPFRTTPKP
jgi:hypothetical protein